MQVQNHTMVQKEILAKNGIFFIMQTYYTYLIFLISHTVLIARLIHIMYKKNIKIVKIYKITKTLQKP